ncbi:MAG: EI24 domain-containing protein [Rhodospirillaceae bacterium]|nr:EI24 domain-containing protein [Rhodospirillaceae bacterium]
MIQAFTTAVMQLRDPRLLKLVLGCIAITVAVYVALFVGLGWVLRTTTLAQLPWLDTLMDLGVGLAAAVLAWLMFPGIVSGVMALVLERVARVVEARTYPHLPPARAIPIMESLGHSLRLLLATIGLNLLCLPLYVVLVFIPPLNLLLFYGVNGKILGREYFETVALRHRDSAAVARLRTQFKGTIWGAGALTTILLTIPGLNLIAPIIGLAAMVHLFHKLISPDVPLTNSPG